MEELQHVLHCTFYFLAKKPMDKMFLELWLTSIAGQIISPHLTVPLFLNPSSGQYFHYKVNSAYDFSSEPVGFPSQNTADAEAEQQLILQNITILAIVQCVVTALGHHLLAKDRLKNSTKGKKYGITKINRKQF